MRHFIGLLCSVLLFSSVAFSQKVPRNARMDEEVSDYLESLLQVQVHSIFTDICYNKQTRKRYAVFTNITVIENGVMKHYTKQQLPAYFKEKGYSTYPTQIPQRDGKRIYLIDLFPDRVENSECGCFNVND